MKKALFLFAMFMAINVFSQLNYSGNKQRNKQNKALTDFSNAKALKTTFLKARGAGSLNALSFTCLYDSIHLSLWDSANNVWTPYFKYINTYNLNGQMTSQIYKQWNDTAFTWTNIEKEIYNYNGDTLLSTIGQEWDTTFWVNSTLDTCIYTGGKLTSVLHLQWYGSAWVYSNLSTLKSCFYSGNNLINQLYQFWNGTNWENSQIDSMTYVGNNKVNSINKSWDNTFNAWGNLYKDTFIYDGNNVVCDIISYPQGIGWSDNSMDFINYNSNNIMNSDTAWVWDYNINDWVMSVRDTFDFCLNNICYGSQVGQFWRNSTWRNNYKFDYYGCTAVSGVNEIKANPEEIAIYPNPATCNITVNAKSDIDVIIIYSVLGDEVISQKAGINDQQSINLNALQEGIYFVSVKMNSGTYVQKIIVQH